MSSRSRTIRRFNVLVALLLIGGGLLLAYRSQRMVWVGGFHLTVNASSTSGPLRWVTCAAVPTRPYAELALEKVHARNDASSSRLGEPFDVTIDPFDGTPINVYIRVMGHDSISGRQLSRTQHSYLVVIAELENGERVGKIVAIPDGRVSREVSVSLP
jgi:hypothetical protein